MLAEKILVFRDFELDDEVQNIENLKKRYINEFRFGDANMQNCKIILKDVKDSKRINANI